MADTRYTHTLPAPSAVETRSEAVNTKVARASSAWVVTLASSQGPAAAGTTSTIRTPATGGTWTSSYLTALPGAETTHLVCAGETFDGYMRGWQVQVNAAVPVYFDIASATGNEIWVSGNVSGLVTANETEFCIIHPVGVNPENGATQTDPCQPESRYLWGSSRGERSRSDALHCKGSYYLPPIVGFEMWHNFDFGVFGAQPGDNKSGQHYMWNRVYDINMGRWTTPDPATSPWTNLYDYVGANPTSRIDPSGLGWVPPIPRIPPIPRWVREQIEYNKNEKYEEEVKPSDAAYKDCCDWPKKDPSIDCLGKWRTIMINYHMNAREKDTKGKASNKVEAAADNMIKGSNEILAQCCIKLVRGEDVTDRYKKGISSKGMARDAAKDLNNTGRNAVNVVFIDCNQGQDTNVKAFQVGTYGGVIFVCADDLPSSALEKRLLAHELGHAIGNYNGAHEQDEGKDKGKALRGHIMGEGAPSSKVDCRYCERMRAGDTN